MAIASIVRPGPGGSPRRAVRVVVVDDHPMIRDVIRFACEDRPGVDVVGQAANGLEAVEVVLAAEPDVVVLDIGLPGLDGFEVSRRLRDAGSNARILVLSGRDDPDAGFQALRAGAAGFVDKTATVEEIVDVVERVAAGARVFPPEVERRALQRLGLVARRVRRAVEASAALTPRERQVLAMAVEGMTTRQIAARLFLSQRTVETHITNVYSKLGVRTRVQALHRAAELGLVELGPAS